MRIFTILTLMMSLMLMTSCAHYGKKSCCSDKAKDAKNCDMKKGECKDNKSCCQEQKSCEGKECKDMKKCEGKDCKVEKKKCTNPKCKKEKCDGKSCDL